MLSVNSATMAFEADADFSGTSGTFGKVIRMWDSGNGAYRIIVSLDDASDHNAWTANETLTVTNRDNSSYTMTLIEWEEVQIPINAITDSERPSNTLAIDQFGAAAMRFSEGEPSFNACNLIRMAEPRRLADYSFYYGTSGHIFHPNITGGATYSHNPDASSLALDVTSATGDRITYTSNKFFRHVPGMANWVAMSLHAGDSGKENCIRRWGLYTDENGFYFELDGSQMSVVVRSTSDGSTDEIRVPQEQWNNDAADGVDRSQIKLHPERHNTYWIDYQSHGAGSVRFGIYAETGRRVTLHKIVFANSDTHPSVGTTSVPIRFEIFNDGSTASPSRLSVSSAAQFLEGHVETNDVTLNSVPMAYSRDVTADHTDNHLVFAFRSAGIRKGRHNILAMVPNCISVFAGAAAVKVSLWKYVDSADDAETWNSINSTSGAEISEDFVLDPDDTNARPIKTAFVAADQAKDICLQDLFDNVARNIHSKADSTSGDQYMITVTSLDTNTAANVSVSMNWIEM